MKILIKRIDKNNPLPKTINIGEWIDLYAACDYELEAPYSNTLSKKRDKRNVIFDTGMIPLGIAMKLPEGFEAILAPRSSTFKNYGVIQANQIGIIDGSYCGDTDEWKMPVIAFRDCTIKEGDRVCQFRIQLSQKATFWQKLKWLFSSKIEIIEVDNLSDNARGGFGEGTGI